MKDKQVAVVYGEDGCELLADIKVVSQQESHKLANEYEKNKSKKLKEEEEHKKKTESLEESVRHLLCRDLLIAKAQYDKFVDRGLLDENKEFDKKFYDFIFENKPLKPSEYPEDFKKILERVVKL